MERRYVIALILMGIVMFAWVFVQMKFMPRNQAIQTREKEQTGDQAAEQKPPVASSVEISRPSAARKPGETVTVETDLYIAKFDTGNGNIISWQLKKYRKKNSDNGELVDLIPFSAIDCLAFEFNDPSLQWMETETTWTADKSELVLDGTAESGQLILSAQFGDKIVVRKILTFHRESYVVDLDIELENLTDEPIEQVQAGYALKWGPGISTDAKKSGRGYGAKVYRFDGKIVRKKKEDEEPLSAFWVAIHSKYWAAAIIPDQALKTGYEIKSISTSDVDIFPYVESPETLVELTVDAPPLGPKARDRDSFRLFVGPKVSSILKQVEAPGTPEYRIRLHNLINLGFFGWLSKIMFALLQMFYKIVRNYGVAIIMVTIVIKIISYPLTLKNLKSTREMQKLQPEIARLKEKYRDDPQKLQKATMNLYKEHGVNPMGGCWPMLLQIPIFWALFSMLRESIELRGAMFIPHWITDLSEPDTIAFLPGLGVPIRILPLLMGASMFIQQRSSGTGGDPQQAKFMRFMPLLFTFFFYGFPSGLVLYWLCNNILTILQQSIMNWTGGKSKEEVSS